MSTYNLLGTLKADPTINFEHLILEAWDKNSKKDQLLARGKLTAKGQFKLIFRAKITSLTDPVPDVYFKVLQKGKVLLSTEDRPMKNLRAGVTKGIELELKLPRASEVKPTTGKIVFGDIQKLGQLSGWNTDKIVKVDNVLKESDLTLSEGAINNLVENGELTFEEGLQLNVTNFLSIATFDNNQVIAALQEQPFAVLGGKPISEVTDFVKLDYATLVTTLTPLLMEQEQEISPELMAHNILMETENQFPTLRLQEQIQPNWEELRGLLEEEPEATPIQELANTYQYFGLGDILNSKVSSGEKIEAIQASTQQLDKFIESNEGFNIITANLTQTGLKQYNFEGVEEQFQPALVQTLQGFQRAMQLAPNTTVAQKILAGGYDSALEIASSSFQHFQSSVDLEETMAKSVYELAQAKSGQLANALINIKDYYLDNTLVEVLDNTSAPNEGELLEELEDYSNFFGNQNFCNCQHCKSILSPAAYFVDLMDFIQENITAPNFNTQLGTENHFLKLQTRRPDLWELPLTCEHTHELVPYLEIINETLEQYLLNRQNWDNKESLYQHLSTASNSFEQPFNWPLEQLKGYLGHFQWSLKEVLELLQPNSTASTYATLSISAGEASLIQTVRRNSAFFEELYNLKEPFEAPVDVQHLLSVMGVSRAAFGKLLQSQYVQKAAPAGEILSIKAVKSTPDSLQVDLEQVENLNVEALDRLHRLTRLWKALGWEVELVDFVVMKEGMNLEFFAQVVSLQEALGVEDVASILGILGYVTDDLLHQVYNLPYFVAQEGKWPSQATFTHPALENTAAENPMVHRFLAALQINDADFLLLLQHLKNALGITDSQPAFELNRANLEVLFQEATLARYLGLPMQDYIALQEIDANNNSPQQLLDRKNTLEASPLSIQEWYSLLQEPSLEAASTAVNQLFVSLEEQEVVVDATTNVEEVLAVFLPEIVGLEGAIIAILLDVLNVNSGEAIYRQALQNGDSQQALAAVLQSLLVWKTVVQVFQLEAEELAFIAQEEGLFELGQQPSTRAKIGQAFLKKLTVYHQLKRKTQLPTAALQSLLGQLTSTWNNALPILSEATDNTPDQVQLTLQYLALPSNGLEALEQLLEVANILQTLGINAQSLSLINTTNYNSLSLAAQALVAAFNTKYSKEEAKEKAALIEEKLLEKKRNALSDYLIHNIHPEFEDDQDLYHYFLLDTELSGCAQTSWVVAANASLQLYVQRVIMNLERDKDALLTIALSKEDQQQWEWRKNYRVWEANRKVFLYPENYILPELRDNKTAAFLTLEKELKQQAVTNATATTSYLNYLETISQEANLQIAGSYKEGDILYLVGKSKEEVPTWYYRTFDVQQQTFGNWQKMDAPITAAYVAPIVYLGTLYVFWYNIQTQGMHEVNNGTSEFKGYKHTVEMQYTSILSNGTWQKVQKMPFPNSPLTSSSEEKFDEKYTLKGFRWDRPYVYIRNGKLYFVEPHEMSVSHHQIDVLNNRILEDKGAKGNSSIYINTLTHSKGRGNLLWKRRVVVAKTESYYSAYAAANIFPELPATDYIEGDIIEDVAKDNIVIHPINNWPSAFIVELGNYSYLTFYSDREDRYSREGYIRIPLNSLLPNQYKATLFYNGMDQLQSLETQQQRDDYGKELDNYGHALHYLVYVSDKIYSLHHPFGNYYQELFFHIPFLIANSLHNNQEYAAADQWYRYIFDPTAAEKRKDKEKDNHPYDRVWQYEGFLHRGQESLKDILSNEQAVALYQSDPFNPHAIARQRRNAYQKTIFMRYIDNLLDWGDRHFSQDTMESINEATLLYVMAYDLLGKRPAEVGDCESPTGEQAKYKSLEGDSAFLKQLETYYVNTTLANKVVGTAGQLQTVQDLVYQPSATFVWNNTAPLVMADSSTINYTNNAAYHPSGQLQVKQALVSNSYQQLDNYTKVEQQATVITQIPQSIYTMASRQIQVFCVPQNSHLLAYWDTVEDRLYKIRNCMNIDGVKRQLALFQPPIDPMLLVKAKAAGLSLQDVLLVTSADKSLYRFSFLIEQAKSFAAKVQNLGAALLDAIERRDAEKLTLIRAQQQQQLQQMSTLSYEQRIQELQVSAQSLKLDEEELNFKISHYENLISTGRIPDEQDELEYRNASRRALGIEQTIRSISAILFLIPNLGSPFAFTYGGGETGNSSEAFSEGLRSLSGLFNTMASAAADQAAHQRRLQGWKYQLALLQADRKDLAQRVIINEIRQKGAERALEIHERDKTYQEEIYNFMQDKFGNEALYSWLVSQQQQLFRQYYKMAMDYARQAEAAYQSERDNQFFIQGNNWNSQYAGLMAGQQLLLQLEQMEQAYLKGASHKMEVAQSFSLRLINPQELLQLQQTGKCTINLPKVLFDLIYPGQYNRRLRSVTVTIPSVTGPYTNVNATLRLVQHQVHKTIHGAAVTATAGGLDSTVVLSSGENDGGLLFSDLHVNKYLPFEGAGAISQWELEFPNQFRSFDYSTISDVVLTLAYTADYAAGEKAAVEQALAGQLVTAVQNQGAMQYINVKQHFSAAFRQLLHQENHTGTLSITSRFFPYYLQDKLGNIRVRKTLVVVEKKEDKAWADMPLTLGVEGLEQYALSGAGTITDNLKEFTFNGLNGQSPIQDWVLTLSSPSTGVAMEEWVQNIHLMVVYELI